MLRIKIPFGFKTLQFDNLYTLYTGKIRVKADYETIVNKLTNIPGLTFTKSTRGCVIISYVTTDFTVHSNNIVNINTILYDIMKQRLDQKYLGVYAYSQAASVIHDELPF